jgi:Family of unknown function (DUF5677)
MTKVTFGFPAFWLEAETKHQKFFDVGLRLQGALTGLTDRAYEAVAPHQKVILNLGILVGVSFMEVITLVGNGFGLGAMKIVRALMEYAINAEYLRLFPDESDDYLEWHWIEQYRLHTWVNEHASELSDSISKTSIQAIEENYQRVRSRFEYTTRNGRTKLRDQWCKLGIADRAVKIGFAKDCMTVMPHANQILHGTIGGLSRHFDLKKDEDRISVPPSHAWTKEALATGHAMTIAAVHTLSKTFDVEPNPSLPALHADYNSAWARAAD